MDPIDRSADDSFGPVSVPTPHGRERPSLIRDWIEYEAKAPPRAARWHFLPRLRDADGEAPTPDELKGSQREVANRYGEPVQFEHLRDRRPHNIAQLVRQPAACTFAAEDVRIVGASDLEIAATLAIPVQDSYWHGGKQRSRSVERLIGRGDQHLWHLGIWPWAAMESPDEIPLRWEWWTDPRCSEAFRRWRSEGWEAAFAAEAELAYAHDRAFPASA